MVRNARRRKNMCFSNIITLCVLMLGVILWEESCYAQVTKVAIGKKHGALPMDGEHLLKMYRECQSNATAVPLKSTKFCHPTTSETDAICEAWPIGQPPPVAFEHFMQEHFKIKRARFIACPKAGTCVLHNLWAQYRFVAYGILLVLVLSFLVMQHRDQAAIKQKQKAVFKEADD